MALFRRRSNVGKGPISRKILISAPIEESFNHVSHITQKMEWTSKDPSKDPAALFLQQEKIGEGSFGAVYKVVHKDSGQVLAAKIISMKQENVKEMETLQGEMEILLKLRHKRTTSYFGCIEKDGDVWLIMELCKYGSLCNVAKLRNGILREDHIAVIMHQSLEGLQYLHENNIVHRDVKAANLLVADDGCIKLADFGVSAQMTESLRGNSIVGTPYYIAPEVIKEDSVDRCKADIWSLGITAIELAEGEPPNYHVHPMRAMFMIPTSPPPTFREPSNWSEMFNDFLTQCLQKDPSKRPSAAVLLQHAFLNPLPNKHALKELVEENSRRVLPKRSSSTFVLDDSELKEDAGGSEGGSVIMGSMVECGTMMVECSDDDGDDDVLDLGRNLLKEDNSKEDNAKEVKDNADGFSEVCLEVPLPSNDACDKKRRRKRTASRTKKTASGEESPRWGGPSNSNDSTGEPASTRKRRRRKPAATALDKLRDLAPGAQVTLRKGVVLTPDEIAAVMDGLEHCVRARRHQEPPSQARAARPSFKTVQDLLVAAGCPDCLEVLQSADVDLVVVPQLTREDWVDLGISIGKRARILSTLEGRS